MLYPLIVRDFLDRAEHVYPGRVAVVDEPDQPAPSLGELTYRELAALARAQAARLDQLGVPQGGRVAIISQNSARLLTSFFGVSGWGRVLVPINFRRAPGDQPRRRGAQRHQTTIWTATGTSRRRPRRSPAATSSAPVTVATWTMTATW